MNLQQLILVVLAVILLAIGIGLAAQGDQANSKYAGIFVRVGIMLFVLWIASPQLESLKERSSLFVMGVIFVLLLTLAARPKILPVAAGLALVTILLNGLLRRLSGKTRKPKNKKSVKPAESDH